MKLIDCFVFEKELDWLQYRLNMLDPYVDTFVIVESIFDSKGQHKRLYSEDIPDVMEQYQHKMCHIVLDSFRYSEEERWKTGRYQFNCLYEGIDSLHLHDEDVLLLSHLDETPESLVLERIKKKKLDVTIHSLGMSVYHKNTKLPQTWTKAKLLTYKMFKQLCLSCSDIREKEWPILHEGGWRLS